MLYVKLTKALYVMLCSAMLFYNNFRSRLEKIGFKINPYDLFVANITINGSQRTVCWNVDYLKVSHKEYSAIDAFVLNICNIFGNCTKFSRVKVHKYLGMEMY